jgi:hypothetical protein
MTAISPHESRTREVRDNRPLHANARTDVLWIGDACPKPLAAALMLNYYNLVEVTPEPTEVHRLAPHARALLIEVAPTLPDLDWALPAIGAALDHGLYVLFTIPDYTDDDEAEKHARDHCYELTKSIVDIGRVRTLYCAWDKIANAIKSFSPNNGCNLKLQIDGDSLDSSAEILLRRAFYDFQGLTLEPLQGGKSGAAVWIAHTSAPDRQRRPAPFLVKWNKLDKMRAEQSNVMEYARNTVSFRLTPPLHPARCIEGATTALLVFDFIDHATTFDTAVRSIAAGQLIGSLFDNTLAGCLRCAQTVDALIVQKYENNNVLRWSSSELREAAERSATLPLNALRDLLHALPPVTHRIATVHGDMHTENLLVAAGSSDVLLIDFGKIMYSMPVVSDAACLEVSLTFPSQGTATHYHRSSPSDDLRWLEAAYSYPMDPHAVPLRDDGERWLPAAVRALRGAARQHDPSPIAYALAIVSYLLRYASYSGNAPVAHRAIAYRLAARLATDIGDILIHPGC